MVFAVKHYLKSLTFDQLFETFNPESILINRKIHGKVFKIFEIQLISLHSLLTFVQNMELYSNNFKKHKITNYDWIYT